MRWNRYRNPLMVLAVTIAFVLLLTIPSRHPLPAQALGQDAPAKTAGKESSRSSSPGPDEVAIRKAVADYVAALSKGDLDAIMAFWAPDAEYVNENGNVTHGKQGIADVFKEVLPQIKGQKVTSRIRSVRTLRTDVVTEDGALEFTAADGTRDVNPYTAVWVKTDGRWLIASARDLPGEAPEGPSLAYSHLQPLEWLVGEWVDDSPKADVRLNCQWGPNKAFLVMNYEVRREGQEPMVVVQRIGWDPHHEMIRSWVFDSQGGFGERHWAREGRRWTVECSGVLPDGGTGGSTNVWEYVDGKTFVWRATDREVDSQPIADVEIKFVRKAQK